LSSATQATETERLNPAQRTAVEHVEGPILVLAGAGSGKTRVLTVRIARLIEEHGVPPERILAVTFTNKASREMKERIRVLLGRDPAGAWVGTFHSLGARLLRRHAEVLGWDPGFTIFDAEESLRELKRVMESIQVDTRRLSPKAIRTVISDAKNQLVSPREFSNEHGDGFDLFLKTAARIYPEYQRSLKTQNAFDFDDLLVKPVELFKVHPGTLEKYQNRFAFVLVDEYQDTNHAQFRFLEAIAERYKNLMVVGDDDQSIYGWRGADIRNILEFERTYPGTKVVRLEQNYRSTGTILAAANAVIRWNVERKEKTLRTDREHGRPVTLVETADESDESAWIAGEIEQGMIDGQLGRYREVAVLYRTNAQSRSLEDALLRKGIPYQIVGGMRFYERREIQNVLAYLRLISNPADMAAFQRVVNYPRRGIGKSTLEQLQRFAERQGKSLLEAAGMATQIDEVPRAGARGLESFVSLIRDYSIRAAGLAVGPLIERLVAELGLMEQLLKEGPEAEDRVENVKELIAGAMGFEASLPEEWEGEALDRFTELDLFLQQVSLVTNLDRYDSDSDAVTLMTLHNAKGLEYPIVFIAGLEDGLFPLSRAYDDPAQLEEERRLFYVGITRARDRLLLSWARERRRAGEFMVCKLSPFGADIPHMLIDTRRSARLDRERAALGRHRQMVGEEMGGRALSRWHADTEAQGDQVDSAEGDEDMNQDLARLVKGERVVHEMFGAGEVVETSGYGRDVKVTVDFDSVGRKRLLARYAGLERGF
jgi:DNA helicase-2/ATP-dependent DNA helicase PcrA